MTMTNAERQAKYRKEAYKRNNGDSDYNLNTWITSQAYYAIYRLSKHHGVTNRAILEKLILDADTEICKKLKETSEYNDYIDRK